MDDRLKANRDHWDRCVDIHVGSQMYNVAGFLAGGSSLLPLELDELGSVSGLRVLHVMCHFGLDTLSLARLGAEVAGVDFSERAIDQARKLAREVGIHAEFHCANVYDMESLDIGRFDLVFMNYGVLCWLPDVHELLRIVAAHLKPGGRYYLLDGHPFAETLDYDSQADRLYVSWPYNADEPVVCECEGTYSDGGGQLGTTVTHEWVHPVSQLLDAVEAAGLELEFLHEHYHVVFERWPLLVKTAPNRWDMPAHAPRVPLMLSLMARRAG